jgi:hypothetical protein
MVTREDFGSLIQEALYSLKRDRWEKKETNRSPWDYRQGANRPNQGSSHSAARDWSQKN